MPFTVEEFFSVFARYNQAIWPLQIVAYLAGGAILALLVRSSRRSAIGILFLLAAMWGINGVGYHWLFFAQVNPAARIFGAIFLLEAILLAISPWLFSGSQSFRVEADARSVVGLVLIAFAAILYPLWGQIAGHLYPATPVFGVAPCPTAIFTVGVLLMGDWRAVRWLLVIPAIWSAVGGSASIFLRVPQDFGLLASLLVVGFFYLAHLRGFAFAKHGSAA